MKRKVELITGEHYHILTRSIAKFTVFRNDDDYQRMLRTFQYYQIISSQLSLSQFLLSKPVQEHGFSSIFDCLARQSEKRVEIIAFCLMPTHLHLILKQLKTNGISTFMSQLANSYTKYFNTKFKRIGSLLQGTFKSVRVETDEQLIHVSRYIHINPVVAGIASKPEHYQWSSYTEYASDLSGYCSTNLILNYFPSRKNYCKFVEDQIDYGKSLETIKHQLLEDE